MIDEHHPMQIGMFPMDMKCQQQQQQQQHQQQHQQQPQNGSLNQLLLNGNERMLTTPTPASASAAAAAAATVTDITTIATTIATTVTGACQPTGNKPGASHNDKMASVSRNVNGSCNNNLNGNTNSNSNSSSNSNSNTNGNSNCNGKSHAHQQQHQQSMAMTMAGQGPGPPVSTHNQQHCNRITLGECSLNGLGSFTAPAPPSLPNTPQAPQILQQHQQQQQQQGMAMGVDIVGVSVGVGVGVGVGPPLNHCSYCCQPICDRYIMRVVDNSFHESCLKCTACSLHLVNSCYAKDGKLYCRIDYERLYIRNRCLGCGHKIASDELVMRCHENVFHLKCFACVVCGSLLKKGEQYVVKQGQLFCRFDYEKEVEMLQGYDFYNDDIFPPKMDGRRGPKRPRTILNTQQRRAFKASFEVSPKPCRKVRENLAKETGLSLRIVQVWFQNQRAKVKKIQKKAKQEPPSKGNSDSQDSQESQDSSLAAKIKDEAHSDSESPMESSPYSSTSDGLARLRCTIKDEQEQVPFNCMETNKENCSKNNEPILNTILGLSYATFQQLMGPFTQTPMINPIDRLYSMQSSYFRPEELGAYGECGGKEPMD